MLSIDFCNIIVAGIVTLSVGWLAKVFWRGFVDWLTDLIRQILRKVLGDEIRPATYMKD